MAWIHIAAAVLGALPAASGVSASASGAKPHILTMLIDDLGYYDTQVRATSWTAPRPFVRWATVA